MRLSSVSCLAIASSLGLGFSLPAAAQTTGPTEELPTVSSDTIVVQGTRERGVTIGNIVPDTVLDESDIASYGVSSLAELLAEIEAETGSSRGRSGGGGPVVLLNGRRISGFREIGRYPPNAVERIEILPEEAALQYGYRADQRVINVILKKDFSTKTADFEMRGPTAGGSVETEYDLGRFVIDGTQRWNISGEYEVTPPLLESERSVTRTDSAQPYDATGNITAAMLGAEIDPALSAMAGETVTVAAVPTGVTMPGVSDFAAGANQPNETDVSDFRSLRGESEKLEVEASIARDLNDVWGVTLSGGFEYNQSQSLQGLAGVNLTVPSASPFNPFSDDISVYRYANELGALMRETDQFTGKLGLTANGRRNRWDTTITANANFSTQETETDRRVDTSSIQALLDSSDAATNPYTVSLTELQTDRAETNTTSYDATIVMTGPVLDLDAGEVRTTLTGEVTSRNLDSSDTVSGVKSDTDLSRQTYSLRSSLDFPIFYVEDEENWGFGNFNINLNGAIDDYSDFGTLYTYGYGLTWQPRKQLRVIASVTEEEGAPSIAQLGDPRQITENSRTYDYVSGETVFATVATGGNPDLQADHRRVMKIGLNFKPFEESEFSIRSDYTDNLIEDPINSIGAASAEIQAALPERFIRNDMGDLIFVDATPFNFAESQRRDIRTGLTWSKRLGASQQGGAQGGNRPSGGGGRGPRAGGRPPGGGGGMRREIPGRVRISLFHTYALEDRILIREGLDEFDLLEGSAIGSGGGQSRNQLNLRTNVFNKGVGVSLNANWEEGTEVIDINGDPSGDLSFSALTTVNLRIFLDLNQRTKLIEKYPLLKDTHVSLFSQNIFDEKREVRDGNGETPGQYQPDLIDPVGRTVGVFVRKSF
ncbi:TonB-dependent receptor plug domain-containing protein [Parvularcula marina]|uniref:TonB-dependent receptor n=1 Tax=Parvularcula marina TaxID=2292771 RepID=A0A371REX8_9PROT|nr:TonB-dependent receptor plug domain-containing protein [Parvularcula marina]RFB04011.1 hypothetical protein DX908_01150 [Parvularcula marina]